MPSRELAPYQLLLGLRFRVEGEPTILPEEDVFAAQNTRSSNLPVEQIAPCYPL